MATKDLTFSGGFLLGAGLMFLLDPDRCGERRGSVQDKATQTPEELPGSGSPSRAPAWAPASWNPGLQCIAGALGVAAVAYGAKWIAQHGRRERSTSTALDIDMPNYAWLR
ncbi:MAG TPA: hypothetical protein VGJ98_07760 [Candidatus Eisenbacteria bacterium]